MKLRVTTVSAALAFSLLGPSWAQPASPQIPVMQYVQQYRVTSQPPSGHSADYLQGWELARVLYEHAVMRDFGQGGASDEIIRHLKSQLEEDYKAYEIHSLPHRYSERGIQLSKGSIAFNETALAQMQSRANAGGSAGSNTGATAGGGAKPSPKPNSPAAPAAQPEEAWAEAGGRRVEHQEYLKQKAQHQNSISSGNRKVTQTDIEKRRQAELEIWELYRRGEITATEHQKLMNDLD